MMENSLIRDRYVNPYTDFGFKKLFGTAMNKELLISFLNALLFGGEEVIGDITYLNTEHLGGGELDRKAVFDVYCEGQHGEKFLVEMQKCEQAFFKDRSLYYATFPIREQARRGTWNYELKAVYAIAVLNFEFDGGENEVTFKHDIKLMDVNTKKVFYDKLSFVYLEMPKFNKKEAELSTMMDKWLFVLKNLSSLLERPAALQDRVFKKLFEAAEIAKFTPRELNEYEDSLKNYRDMFSVISTAEQKGHAAGLAEGLEQGIAKGLEQGLEQGRTEGEIRKAMEIARALKSSGMPLAEISRITGLSNEKLAEL